MKTRSNRGRKVLSSQHHFVQRLITMGTLLGMLVTSSFIFPLDKVEGATLETITPTVTATPQLAIPTPITLQFSQKQAEVQSSWGSPLYEVPFSLTPHDHFYFNRPTSMSSTHWALPDYRYGYFYPEEDVVHSGIDIVGYQHDPVLAAAAGKVVFAGYGLLNGPGATDDPYGNAVMIKHSFKFQDYAIYTVYAHLDRINVKKGEWVTSGEQVGTIGMTGMTSGPHLHFEVRIDNGVDGKVQNPELWLVPPIGHGVLTGQIENSYGASLSSKKIWLKSLETGNSISIISYAAKVKQVDNFYQENFAIGDLPAGKYEISTYYYGVFYKSLITIAPGAVNFVQFRGTAGFSQSILSEQKSTDFIIPVQ
jgi:murein DD-endopeptidase MepM/ murein hydrolase activator NlpD